jgi:hypothetical protein
MIRTAICAAAAAAALLAPALAGAAEDPKDVVGALYTESSLAFGPAKSAGYFSRDLDAALGAAARAGRQPVDFDYRYGYRDLQISGLEILQEVDNDQARVVAVFKNYGRANSVDWALCRRPDGEWRIDDASSNTGEAEWDLRRTLNLPVKVAC